MPGSALIVNNHVMLAGDAGHAATGGSRLLYIATRPGAVALPTEDDLRIERENALMAKLGYIGFRPGSVSGPDSGHALFDASGVPDRAAVQRELLATDSAIVTSVLSVRLEDGEAMRLATKQDWERLVRAEWPRYIERMGVIAPENVRWVAAMHVCDHSYHVHIFTWDASGRFNSLLPRRKMAKADDAIRLAVLKPLREVPNLSRTLARDDLVTGVRRAIAESEGVRESVRRALPDAGSLKYANLARRHEPARLAVDAAVEKALAADRALSAKREAYLAAACEHARLRGLSGSALAAHVAAAENDLRTRLGNAAIAAARPAWAEGREEPRRRAAAAEGAYGPPSERRRARAMAEEVASLLKPGEQRALSRMLADCAAGAQPDAEALRIARKLPTVRMRAARSSDRFPDAVHASLSKNGRRIARILSDSAKRRRKGDFGDEVGRTMVRESTACLGRALSVMAIGLPAPAGPGTPQRAAVNIHANSLMKG